MMRRRPEARPPSLLDFSDRMTPPGKSLPRVVDLAELGRLFERSHERPVLLFKHSPVCSVSSVALGEVERFVAEAAAVEIAVVEVQAARPAADEIARRTGVRHESPQAILLAAGRPAWHASHWQVTRRALAAALAAAPDRPAAAR